MKNWKRLVRILLCAAILTALLTGATALADDPASPSDLTNSASIQVVNAPVTDGAVSGLEYYQLIITLPASANGNFQWGWDTDLTKTAPDEWYNQKLEWFVPYGENACRFITDGVPADVTDEALFIRLNEDDTNVQKLIFHYDKTEDTSLTISNLTLNGTPGLLAPVNVTWKDIQGALFKVFWNTPNGLRTYLTGNRPYFKTGNDEFDRVENLMAWVGNYEVWVLPIKDGRGGVPSDHLQFTVAEPAATDAVTLTVIDGLTGEGKAQLNQNVQFRIEAPGAERIRFFNSDWLDEFDVDENGTAERGWMATDAEEAGKTFRFYAQALFINNGVGTWVTSSLKDITVDNYNQNDVLQGDVTWSIVGNPQSAARNSVLTIEAGPVAGADYFAAFITNHGNWVTESHWMRANETGTTLLSLPMLDCEPGDSYDIHVYAAKIGVPRKYSDTIRTIPVTAPPEGTGDILFAMKNTFVAGEPLQIRALYTNPNNLQNAWMHIRIYNKNDHGDRPYENGQGFRFRDDGFSISHAGTYVLEAVILQHVDDGEPNEITRTSFEITVDSDGPLGNISLFGIPALHSKNTDLHYGFNAVTGAENYGVILDYCPDQGDWEELVHDSIDAPDEAPLTFEQTFNSGLFAREGKYRIWVGASAYNKDDTWDERFFYVINGTVATDSDLILTAEDNAGNEVTPEQLQLWPSSKHLEFRLYAPGANAVRFLNYEGNWEYRDGSNVDEEGWFSWGRGPGRGTYAVVAQAAYDGPDFPNWTGEDWDAFSWDGFNWNSAFSWTATSNEIPITVYSNGNMQPAVYTLNKNSLVRGENLVVTISNWDQLADQEEWYGANFMSLDGWESDYISWDEATKQIVIPTADFEAGNYVLRIWADAEGIEGAAVYADVTITEPTANSIIFNAGPANPVLDQRLSVSIYAPDAQHVGFSVDGERWDLDENGNYVWGEYPSWTNYEDVRWDEPRDVGEHTLQAFAFYTGTGWVAGEEITVTVRSLGKLEFDLTTLPGVVATSTDLIINLPEDADHMNIGVYEDWDDENLPDGYGRKTIFRRRELSQGLTVRIPEENVVPGHRIVIDMDAWAHGYEGDWRSISIPIINAPGDSALIYIDGGDIEQGRVLVDGEVRFIVTPVHDNDRITAIRFYDGEGFWEWGEAITHDNHPDWFTDDGDFFAWCYFHDSDRTYSVYAEVQLNGSNEWVTTNVLSFVLKVNGIVDTYDFTDLTPITAARGESVSFTFTPAAGATRYWADAFDTEEWYSFNPTTVYDGTTVTMSTVNLPVGTYHIVGRAGAEPGIQWSESTHALTLTVTEPEIPASGVLLKFSKPSVETLEPFIISVHAPGAQKLRLCHNDPDNEWWVVDGVSCAEWNWMADVGTQTFYASAMFNGVWSQPQAASITVTGEGHAPASTVAYASATVEPNSYFRFFVSMPEGADNYAVWANDSDGNSVLDWEERYESSPFDISTVDMSEGDSFHLTVRTAARGKESTYFDLDVLVTNGAVMDAVTFTTPAALETIEEEAFCGIAAQVIRVSDQVTTIGDRAFADSQVRQIYIPSSVTSMSGSAFDGCENVTIFSTEDSEGYSYAQLWVINHPEAPCRGVILSE